MTKREFFCSGLPPWTDRILFCYCAESAQLIATQLSLDTCSQHLNNKIYVSYDFFRFRDYYKKITLPFETRRIHGISLQTKHKLTKMKSLYFKKIFFIVTLILRGRQSGGQQRWRPESAVSYIYYITQLTWHRYFRVLSGSSFSQAK